MKNIKIKNLLILTILLCIPFMSVHAGSGIPATRSSGILIPGTDTIKYSFCGLKNGSHTGAAKTSKYVIHINDKNYDAYCIDPGNKTPSSTLQCSLFKDEGLTYLFEQKKAGVDDATFVVALRLYALKENLIIKLGQEDAGSKLDHNFTKSAFIQFWQIDSGADLTKTCGPKYSRNKWDYLFEQGVGQGNAPTGILARAYSLYQQASTRSGYSEESLGKGLRFTEKVYKGKTAEHHLVSDTPIKKEDLGEPECENCSVVSFDWNGTSGSITVAADCNKDYKVGISSMDKGVYACNGLGTNTQTLLMLAEEDTEAKLWDEGKIPCDREDCCTTGTEIEPGHIEGTVHNCCEDGGNSEAHEYNLDDLFCKDDDLRVDYYYPKCKTDYYIQEDTDLNEKYCKMYCTERVSTEIPGAITATSGRYFELTTTSKGTKSPYIEGFKRCRIRVQYDIWEQDYYDVVEKQKDAYNKFQELEVYEKIYEHTINNNKTIETAHLKAECSVVKKSSGSGSCDASPTSGSAPTPFTWNGTYELYNFAPAISKYPRWHTVKIDETLRNKASNTFNAIELKYDKSPATKKDPSWSEWNLQPHLNDMNNWINNNNGKRVGSSDSCTEKDKITGKPVGSKTEWYELECKRTSSEEKAERVGAKNENVTQVYQSYVASSDSANNTYNAAARQAKQLEEDIDKCDNYFTKYKGANAKENYDFDASMDFYYTQVYMDNEKGLQLDEQYITFKDTPGCVITGPTLGPDGADKLAGKRYSANYKNGIEKMTDFKETKLSYESTNSGFQKYRDALYNADKLFTHDAKYRAECSWDEGENVYYTLSPNGSATESTDVINFTEHGQEYRLFLSTLDGTYETYWRLVGLGSRQKGTAKGKFDDFFASQGNTCANESPSETAMFTCKLHVEYEIVLTGYCNGSNGTDTTVNVADCDPYKEGYNLFTFKVVDAANLFPNGYSTEAGDVAYNWSSTDAGQKALKEIQERGKADKTYSREFLTYSFILSPTDMGHIKNYNVEANVEGGYSDFRMDCACSGTSCINCKSRFINELANGNVIYDGQNHSVTGWSNKQTNLDGVRRKYGW